MNLKWISAALLMLIGVQGYTQHLPFEYKRKINPVSTEDWCRIILPSVIFQYLNRELTDLRIYSITNTDTLEIPYILKIKSDEVNEETIELPILNQSKKDNKLYFTASVPIDKKINTLHLDFAERNYDGLVSLEGSHNQKDWFEIETDKRILSIHEGTVAFKSTTVSFPVSDYAYLRAAISSTVPLTELQASFKSVQTKKGEIKPIPVQTLVTENKNQQTSVIFKLEFPVPVTKIEVGATNAIDFYRNYALEYLYDSVQTQKGWLHNYNSLQHGYLTSFKPNVIEFAPVVASLFKLTILNQDNPPITVNQIDVFGPEVELVTNLKPGDNFLFYKSVQAKKPNYDLVRFEEKIPEQLQLAALLPPEPIESISSQPGPLFQNSWWLWGIMALIIGILGYFTLRMLTLKQS